MEKNKKKNMEKNICCDLDNVFQCLSALKPGVSKPELFRQIFGSAIQNRQDEKENFDCDLEDSDIYNILNGRIQTPNWLCRSFNKIEDVAFPKDIKDFCSKAQTMDLLTENLYQLVIAEPYMDRAKKLEFANAYPFVAEEEQINLIVSCLKFALYRSHQAKPIVLSNMNIVFWEKNVPKPSRHFVGRKAEVQQLREQLADKRMVSLYGEVGIGKSEVAKKLASEYTEGQVLFLRYDETWEKTCAANWFQRDLGVLSPQTKYEQHEMFLYSLDACDLLIIDGVNTLSSETGDMMSLIEELKCKVLITTRCRYENFFEIHLKPFEDICDLLQLVAEFYKIAPGEREIITKTIQAVHGHTAVVEILGRLLNKGTLTPCQLLRLIKQENIKLECKELLRFYKDSKATKRTYYNHIRLLYSLFDLNDTHKLIMSAACILPNVGVKPGSLAHWLSFETTNEICELEEYGFLHSDDDYYLSIMPMMCDVAKSEIMSIDSIRLELLDRLDKAALMYAHSQPEYDVFCILLCRAASLLDADVFHKTIFLENIFGAFEKYDYLPGMEHIIAEFGYLRAQAGDKWNDEAIYWDMVAAYEKMLGNISTAKDAALRALQHTGHPRNAYEAMKAINILNNYATLECDSENYEQAYEIHKSACQLRSEFNIGTDNGKITYDMIPQNCNYALVCAYTGRTEEGFVALREVEEAFGQVDANTYFQIVMAKAALYASKGDIHTALVLCEGYVNFLSNSDMENYYFAMSETIKKVSALRKNHKDENID